MIVNRKKIAESKEKLFEFWNNWDRKDLKVEVDLGSWRCKKKKYKEVVEYEGREGGRQVGREKEVHKEEDLEEDEEVEKEEEGEEQEEEELLKV